MNEIIGQKKGFFVSFEGLDGSGKSMQVDLLRQALQKTGFTVNMFRSPGSTKIGEVVRTMVKDSNNKNMSHEAELLLMCADRAQLVYEKIKPALDNGEIVLCDRFYHSTIIYQGFGREADMNMVRALSEYSVIDTLPNLTFLLDVSKEEAAKRKKSRGTSDRFEQEDIEYQARIRAGFDWLKTMEGKSKGKLIVINADSTPEEVHTEIFRHSAFNISKLKEGQLKVDAGKKIIV